MKKPIFLFGAVLALVVSQVSGVAAASVSTDRTTAIVQLVGAPLATSPRTRPAKGQQIDFSGAAVRSERAALAQTRNSFQRWLAVNAPKARITGSFDIALNAVSVKLNGTSLSRIRSAPQVVSASYQAIFRPLAHEDPDLTLVRAEQAWNSSQVGGAANAGRGVKVAVIDSGIDVTHPCFNDAGYPNTAQIGDADFTNNKVIVAKFFNNKAKKLGVDAADLNGHGTHVAGTIACNVHTPAVVNGVDIPYDPSGVAPAAWLGNYNVFPGEVGEARSEDILNALEEAYEDGFDVANMSLGGARNDGGGAFLLDNAIDNLDRANMVIAVAAGNEGPGYWTVHYPGAAPRALTAGASTVGHGIVNLVTVAGTQYEAVVGDFKILESDLTAPLAVVSDPNSGFPHNLNIACDDSPPLPDLTGEIALLGRGVCDFTVKMRNAQNAGAVGVIMVNRVVGEAPFVMSHNGLEAQPTIPGYMVSLEDGAEIDDHDGASATLHADGVYATHPEDTNNMASFSSWGPTHGDMLIKPDATAPGADVLSAQPAWVCNEEDAETVVPCWAFFGGTSMATPHLAGAAAVVRGAHATWTAAQVRSAVTNTAQQNVLKHPALPHNVTNDALIVGAGLLDVEAAVKATAALDPVSRSFRSVPSASGRDKSSTIVLTNLTSGSQTYSLAIGSDTANDGATFSVGTSSVTLAAGASATVTIMVDTTRGAADGFKQAQLNISAGGSEVAHAMLLILVGEADAAPGQHMTPPAFL